MPKVYVNINSLHIKPFNWKSNDKKLSHFIINVKYRFLIQTNFIIVGAKRSSLQSFYRSRLGTGIEISVLHKTKFSDDYFTSRNKGLILQKSKSCWRDHSFSDSSFNLLSFLRSYTFIRVRIGIFKQHFRQKMRCSLHKSFLFTEVSKKGPQGLM